MRSAKQVQLLRSPITLFAIVLVISVGRISFTSYRITVRLGNVVFARIKNVYEAFQRVKMSMSSSSCFLAGAGIVRSRLVHRDLPEAPPVRSFCVSYVLACARKMWVLPQSILWCQDRTGAPGVYGGNLG